MTLEVEASTLLVNLSCNTVSDPVFSPLLSSKHNRAGTSLAVRVVKILPSNVGGAGSILIGELRFHMPQNQNTKNQKQYCNKSE